MYQIFVVEDELLIRQNIRSIVENMQGPYSFCGEASDGEMALSMIQEMMPDILLTDIRMPFLDGLGLIKYAKAMMPWLKVAVISGYGDFEYAQKAIALGVNQYLLKPVRQAELVRAVHEMASQLDKERTVSDSLVNSLDQADVQTALKRQWLEQLLYEQPDLNTLLEKAEALKLDVVKGNYLVVLLSFDSSDVNPYQLKNAVRNALREASCELYLFNTADQMTLLSCDNDADELNERVYQLISILRHELQDICPVITAVISRRTTRLGGIGEAYYEAGRLMRTLRNISAGKVVNLNDTITVNADIASLDSPFGTAFLEKLQYAVPEDIPAMVDDALAGNESDRFESMLIRYQALDSAVRAAARLMSGSRSGEDERAAADVIREQFDLLKAAGSKNSFREAVTGILQTGIREQAKRVDDVNNYNYIISRAEAYARENFRDANISLLTTAQHVGMSSAYFSTVFSQTKGQSFIAFLTELRVEKAKELLTSTRMRLSDIAIEIGYNEPNYFSHVFRKATGMTPKEYRQLNGGQ